MRCYYTILAAILQTKEAAKGKYIRLFFNHPQSQETIQVKYHQGIDIRANSLTTGFSKNRFLLPPLPSLAVLTAIQMLAQSPDFAIHIYLSDVFVRLS